MAFEKGPSINIRDYILEKCVPAKPAPIKFKILFTDNYEKIENCQNAQQGCVNLSFPFARSPVVEVTINKSAELVQADEELNTKRVEELSLECSSHFADYEPGDTVAILPSNSADIIDAFLIATGLELQAFAQCQIRALPQEGKKPTVVPPYIPAVTTPHQILQDCLDLNAVPKKQFLSSLAQCCENKDEREFLNCLSSKEGSPHYNRLFLEQALTLRDLLACLSCKVPFELLIQHLPRLMPRPYSIANSPLTGGGTLRIIYSLRAKQPGVTTAMLSAKASKCRPKAYANLPPKVAMYLREPNKFRYTAADVASNQILIGIGTALAPFIGFLEHKQQHVAELAPQGVTWLYVGATTKQSVLYRDYLMRLRNEGVLQGYGECLSREPIAPYRYMQELLAANSKEFVAFFMQPTTTLYLCADGAIISKSLQAAIAGCMMRELHLEEVLVMEMIKSFRESGKYREDLWL